MRILAFFLLSALAISCNDDKELESNECSSLTSIEAVPWMLELQETITNCSCKTSIIKGTYHSQTVFFVVMNDELCNGINSPTLFNCKGEEVKSFTSSAADQEDFYDEVSWDLTLYSCKE
jgi:hypothetical protein